MRNSLTARMGRRIGFHLSVAIIGLVMIYPILWLAGSSFKASGEIWTNVSSLFPQNPTFEHYVNGWRGFGGVSFSIFYRNTTIITVLGTLGVVFSSAFTAFGFARLAFPLRRFLFACMLITMMLPVQIQIIPQYIMFSKFGLVNTFLPLILPKFFGMPFFIFMGIQFIRGIPRTLDEAAEIDGCSHFSTYFRIILPLCSPALITSAIFSFYWTWSEFLSPLIYLNDPKLYTISQALRSFADPSGMTDWGAIFAMSFLSLVPVFIVFLILQRNLLEGISTSGIKG